MIGEGAPQQEPAKEDGDQRCPRLCADADAGEFPAHCVSGAAFEPLDQRGDRQCGRVGNQAGRTWSASPLHSTNAALNSSHTSRMVVSQSVSMASVNTGRRFLVTNTR